MIKNIGSDVKNLADKAKKVEDVTGLFKFKFGGKGDVKDMLNVVSVSTDHIEITSSKTVAHLCCDLKVSAAV